MSLISSFVGYLHNLRASEKVIQKKIESHFFQANNATNYIINHAKFKVLAAAGSNSIANYAQKPNNDNLLQLQESLFTLIKTSSLIYQMRFLDLQGKEVIRVEKTTSTKTPYSVVRKNKLSDKSNRYDFTETLNIKKMIYIYQNWASILSMTKLNCL